MSVGDRVELHPCTDEWMQGDRFGNVLRIGTKWIHVRLDSGRVRRFLPRNLMVRETK